MPNTDPRPTDTPQEAYPLKRQFYVRVVPALVVFVAAMCAALWLSFNHVSRDIYLEQSMHRTEMIADTVKDTKPEAWAALLAGTLTDAHHVELEDIFAEEVERQRLSKLKVYDLRGEVIYDTDATKIGTLETAEPFRQTVITGAPNLLREAAGGEVNYEIYTPFFDADGNFRLVFELYESVDYLDSILLRSAGPAIAVPVILQTLLALLLGVMVYRAQAHIDAGIQAIAQLSHRLQSFVSASAIKAAHTAHDHQDIASQKIDCTLFHSDVRAFSSYAEDNSPERVVAFLNDIMTVQVNTVQAFGGDVDKMIGDALLVRFEGDNAERRAIDAAKAILTELDKASLARGLGIGIFTGSVISGAIGPRERRDFTVIGDSVNLSARLCSEAGDGEIVADTRTVAAAKAADFAAEVQVQVKGRSEGLGVRRWCVER